MLRGASAGLRRAPADPLRQRLRRPRAGVGGEEGGVGGPATAGKRWPHFFQMGKLRHKEVFFFFVCFFFFFWDLAQVTHSESAFGEGTAHTPGNKVTRASVPSPTGQAGQGRGPKAAWRGTLGCSEGLGGRAHPGRASAWHWVGPSPVRESRQGGILVRTGFSGKMGIHFKISAQKGSRAVLKPGRAPGPYRSPS